MKTLFLVRHAKSSWKETGVGDFDRPLNKRGKRDAPFMAKLLNKQNVVPDLIITSPAKRALTTAEIFADELSAGDKLEQEPDLYMADRDELIKAIRKTSAGVNVLMAFAHNPGLTNLLNYLTNKEIENIPTCGVVKLELKVSSWNQTGDNTCELAWFEYPKKYF